ncbi:MAG: NADH-quinone oxidoreductase subunit L [Candidatus Hinthialibacter antarcticus]|nr:NADH-quinone oxidoreductase subunit L [Candidatus Hinthialibacter antarcticus]
MALIEILSWLILALPLGAFAIQMAFGPSLPRKGDWVSITAVSATLLFGLLMFFRVIVLEYNPDYIFPATVSSYHWFSGGSLDFTFGFHIDNLTCVMLIVVGLVSTLVHFYSIGYMHNDPLYHRFYGYLSLFTFSMYLLVLCDNLFVLYIAWELVGVSSYLLIGYYYQKHSAANACIKAFLTTRVGDVFMFAGILIIAMTIGAFNYREVFEAVAHGELSGTMLMIASICLFGGAVGKSAQFPLHIWLPDAMEGPTPVSALIHAATMVAAGVYMVGRLFPMFSLSDEAMLFIAYTGLITAFFAATIAITQNDIKRVLAYSTISQLGYMVAALGVGAYTAGLYHLMTHAFFKALLFLCSGSVIHAAHTQDMREMGGLRSKMPITFWTMMIGTLAIAGVPLFSGFGSKDAIMAGALQFGVDQPQHFTIFIGLLIGAGITAFYMFRLMFMTFFGETRNQKSFDHAHESPMSMTVPLMVLAAMSIIGGFGAYGSLWFDHLVVPMQIVHDGHGEAHHAHNLWVHYGAMAMSVLVAATGIFISYVIYFKKWIPADRIALTFRPLYQLSLNKYYVDEFYWATIIGFVMWFRKVLASFDRVVVDGIVNATAPILRGSANVSGGFDRYVVDGALNLGAVVVQAVGSVSTLVQNGVIQSYILKIAMAVAVILIIHQYLQYAF